MASHAPRFARVESKVGRRAGSQLDTGLESGLVVVTHGRHCIVETASRRRLICHPRGKKSEVVVGDRVRWQLTHASGDEGVIEQVEPRRNLLFRQDEWRSKSFAANLDQLLIWIAVEPVFSEAQLTRALIAAEDAQIAACIVLNKTDLPGVDAARSRLVPYKAMGYDVLELSLKHQADEARALLAPYLNDRTTLVLGPSGAGKSTLINAIAPAAKAEIGEISKALNSGKHTTTTTQWYWADGSSSTALIDSPGFQEFGMHHIPVDELALRMPDLAAHVGHCKFYNCTHLHEPGCGVIAAVQRGEISPTRHKLYAELRAELSQPRW